jgi:Raf kinase inhibitor-like YbhB/YbcL family protein
MGRMRVKALVLAAAVFLALPAGASAATSFRLTSPAFRSSGTIPKRFTCDGPDVSPPLRWTAPPRRTRSLALVVEDTSTAPPFTHWLAWGLAPRVRGLVSAARLTLQGRNDFGRAGYGGPCPPGGTKHRYVFRLYALRKPLKLAAGASARDLAKALKPGNILGQASLVGTYRRPTGTS